MRRPTRTRRLSIAAIVSLLALVAVAGVGVRSFWTYDQWNFISPQVFRFANGRVSYFRWTGRSLAGQPGKFEHLTGRAEREAASSIFKFEIVDEELNPERGYLRVFEVAVPLWCPLLMLLIAPMCWLIARSVGGPAFPVITIAKAK